MDKKGRDKNEYRNDHLCKKDDADEIKLLQKLQNDLIKVFEKHDFKSKPKTELILDVMFAPPKELTYKEYKGSCKFNGYTDMYYGSIINTYDFMSYESDTIEGLQWAFEKACEEDIKECGKRIKFIDIDETNE